MTTDHPDKKQHELRAAWEDAMIEARVGGSNHGLINILRDPDLMLSNEDGDLAFISDVLANKFQKSKGRQKRHKISIGLIQALVAETVRYFMNEKHLSFEAAVEKTAELHLVSEKSIMNYCTGIIGQTFGTEQSESSPPLHQENINLKIKVRQPK
jgi:hypothetical protein